MRETLTLLLLWLYLPAIENENSLKTLQDTILIDNDVLLGKRRADILPFYPSGFV